jgi:hypothetical protein
MRYLPIVVILLVAFCGTDAGAQAGYCDCYGGLDVSNQYWQLLDSEGIPLEDGDWVYAAWTGPDGEIAPPGPDGYPTEDDELLPISNGRIEYSTFFITVASWPKGAIDDKGDLRHPTDGDLIYCRIFDGPQDSIGTDHHYADSQTHEIFWKLGDVLYCLFPGDPGHGHTDKLVPDAPAEPDSAGQPLSKPCEK